MFACLWFLACFSTWFWDVTLCIRADNGCKRLKVCWCTAICHCVRKNNLPLGMLGRSHTARDGGKPDLRQRKQSQVMGKVSSLHPSLASTLSRLARKARDQLVRDAFFLLQSQRCCSCDTRPHHHTVFQPTANTAIPSHNSGSSSFSCTCICITNHFFSLTDTAASASAILLQLRLRHIDQDMLPTRSKQTSRQSYPLTNK